MGIFDKVTKLFKKEDKDKLEQEKLEKESLIKQSETEEDPFEDPDIQDFLERADEPGPWSEEDDEIYTVGGLTNDKESGFMEFQKKMDDIDEELEPEPAPEPNPESELEIKESSDSEKRKIKLDSGLKKTKDNFFSRITKAVAGKSTIDELALDDIEEALITSDIGVDTTIKIIEALEERVERDKYINSSEINIFLKEEISDLMKDSYDKIPEIEGPYVIMVVGVNGVGKTTTIGKLAHQFKKAGKKVVLGAADTFRAAAVDQLVIWSERVGVDIVKQDMGSDPASVAFDTLQSAKASNADVVIIDTAGRLHNNVNLMRELGKIRNVMTKVIPESPHDVMLVLDASTGQNAIEQATQFTAATEVNSIALTKLDGTAKGGVVIGISDQFQIPVRYIGVGEGLEDLQQFDKTEFIDSLFN